MNSKIFCREFEKIFGRYKSKRIREFSKILCGDKEIISSSYGIFLYEMCLYLNIPVSEVKKSFLKECR